MRRIHYADVSSAARALMTRAVADRVRVCLRMIRQAEVADAHRLATGKAHPKWGTGSLMEVARLHPMAAEPGFENPSYVAALRVVLTCLHQNAFNRTHN